MGSPAQKWPRSVIKREKTPDDEAINRQSCLQKENCKRKTKKQKAGAFFGGEVEMRCSHRGPSGLRKYQVIEDVPQGRTEARDIIREGPVAFKDV